MTHCRTLPFCNGSTKIYHDFSAIGNTMPKTICPEALVNLKNKLATLPPRSSERRAIMRQTAETYGMSEETLYRLLRSSFKPKTLKRADHGKPRILSSDKMEYYCEIIAAIRTRTTNKKNRHLSTAEAIRLMEDPGVQTDDTFVKIPKGLLNKSTVNRYLKLWGFDFRSINKQPPSVRFQAQHSNDCWHFDMSPSDLKYIKCPPWVRTDSKRPPILMLYSVVDDRSGVSYQEYHCVYGEDIEAALRLSLIHI